jgi:hypothetical protein
VSVQSGICSEFHVHREIATARFPTVYFCHRSTGIRFRGDLTEGDLSTAIDSFLNRSLTRDSSFDDEGFYRLNEFEEHCQGITASGSYAEDIR